MQAATNLARPARRKAGMRWLGHVADGGMILVGSTGAVLSGQGSPDVTTNRARRYNGHEVTAQENVSSLTAYSGLKLVTCNNGTGRSIFSGSVEFLLPPSTMPYVRRVRRGRLRSYRNWRTTRQHI